MTFDLMITNGFIVDGSGKPGYAGNLAVQDGRIAAIGDVSGNAGRTLDAGGRVVAPGCESRMALIAVASFIEFRQRWR